MVIEEGKKLIQDNYIIDKWRNLSFTIVKYKNKILLNSENVNMNTL